MDGDFGMRKFKRVFVQTTGLLLFFTLLCGAGYTALLTGAAQLFFPWQANGSLLLDNDEVVGSALLGQPFCGKGHLWGRMLWDSESFRQSAPDGVWLFDGQSAAQSISAPDYPAMLAFWMRTMSGAGLDDAAIERMRTGYARDVAILPPDRVAALVESAGFDAPLRFHQAGMIHGWCARRP